MRGRRAFPLANAGGQPPVELPAKTARDLFSLVEATLGLASPVQRHRHNQIRPPDAFRHAQGQQFTQRPGSCQLLAELGLGDQPVDRILIGERRPDPVEIPEHGQAMWLEPGQISEAPGTQRPPRDRLATQGAVRRQEQVQNFVNLDPAHKLTDPAGSPDTAALFNTPRSRLAARITGIFDWK